MEFENYECKLKFTDVSKIADYLYYKLRNEYWYEVLDFNYDGSAIIILENGITFSLTKEEMKYTEIKEVSSTMYDTEFEFLHNEDFYSALEIYDYHMNFNPAAHIHINAKVNTESDIGISRNGDKTDMSELEVEKWVRAVENEVNRRYIDAEIDRLLLEPVLNAEELSKLVGIKYRKST